MEGTQKDQSQPVSFVKPILSLLHEVRPNHNCKQ